MGRKLGRYCQRRSRPSLGNTYGSSEGTAVREDSSAASCIGAGSNLPY